MRVVPGWRQKVYKYMRIYLWTALRNLVLRMRDLRIMGILVGGFGSQGFFS